MAVSFSFTNGTRLSSSLSSLLWLGDQENAVLVRNVNIRMLMMCFMINGPCLLLLYCKGSNSASYQYRKKRRYSQGALFFKVDYLTVKMKIFEFFLLSYDMSLHYKLVTE